MTVAERIRQHIEGLPKGEPFKPAAFYAYGLRATIDQVLSRLARSGWLTRVARGVYVRPLHNEWIGPVLPSPFAVAQAVAGEEILQVNGAEACRQLRLSTQTPTRPLFLTSGPSRTVAFGQLGLRLKHVSERKLVLSNSLAGVALTALHFLGREEVTLSTLSTLEQRLPPEEFQRLLSARVRSLMPAWLANLFFYYEQPNKTSIPQLVG